MCILTHSSFYLPDKITDEAEAKAFLEKYNSTAEVVWNAYTEASWTYNVNITEHNKQIMVGKSTLFSNPCRNSQREMSKTDNVPGLKE